MYSSLWRITFLVGFSFIVFLPLSLSHTSCIMLYVTESDEMKQAVASGEAAETARRGLEDKLAMVEAESQRRIADMESQYRQRLEKV